MYIRPYGWSNGNSDTPLTALAEDDSLSFVDSSSL